MTKYLLLAIAFVVTFSACHKSTGNGITYTNDSVTVEMDYTKTTYHETKAANGGYYTHVKISKYDQTNSSYYLEVLADDLQGSITCSMNIVMNKMPDGSFRLDSTNTNALSIPQYYGYANNYAFPAGPVIFTHEGNDYVQGSFEGTVQCNTIIKQIKCTFRATIEQ